MCLGTRLSRVRRSRESGNRRALLRWARSCVRIPNACTAAPSPLPCCSSCVRVSQEHAHLQERTGAANPLRAHAFAPPPMLLAGAHEATASASAASASPAPKTKTKLSLLRRQLLLGVSPKCGCHPSEPVTLIAWFLFHPYQYDCALILGGGKVGAQWRLFRHRVLAPSLSRLRTCCTQHTSVVSAHAAMVLGVWYEWDTAPCPGARCGSNGRCSGGIWAVGISCAAAAHAHAAITASIPCVQACSFERARPCGSSHVAR